ncbi:MAG: HAMP domain-containing sensor histidine kinase [Candidatus Cloacimonetes bacterium]|nr:HAMP domain-containing sensor histidine kinase [Candidatus Cloacimonadota bacterium]
MQIRTRLAMLFLFIGGVIMIIASAAVYFSSASFRRDYFYKRLENKANNTAKLLIEVDEIDVNLLKKIETDNPVNLPEEKIIIFDYKNKVLYSSDEKNKITIDPKLNNRIRLEGEIKFKHDKYEVLGVLYTERYDRFVVIASAIDIDGLSKLRNLRIILIIVCLSSFIIFSVAGWIFAAKALLPISGVVRRVEEIEISSLNLRVDEGNGTDEIAKLARTFNNMLERLEVAFKLQKDFISNASHEIRTPLTSINGQIEVLLMKERSSEEYISAVSSVLEDIKTLTDLANRLLLLAHATSGEMNANHRSVRIDEILWQAKEEMRKFKKEYNINVSLGSSISDAEQMIIHGDEYLLKTALLNIIENSCKYSDNHSVDVNIENNRKQIIISFSDKGIGIPEEDLDEIFEPFHRGSNAKAIEGHGIGLSLVYQVIKNHNGTINISSIINQGTTVEIKLSML